MKKPSLSVPSKAKNTTRSSIDRAIAPSQEHLHVTDEAYFMNLNHGSRAGFDVEHLLRVKASAEAYERSQIPDLKAPYLKPL